MTILRWILWVFIGGFILSLFERLFGGPGIPAGAVAPDQLMDPASQIGSRGTGIGRTTREQSWRTQFSSPLETIHDWRGQFTEDGTDTDTVTSTDTSWNYDSCSVQEQGTISGREHPVTGVFETFCCQIVQGSSSTSVDGKPVYQWVPYAGSTCQMI